MSAPLLAPRPGWLGTPVAPRPQLVLTHCESEWAALRPQIERMYIQERRKLRYIMQKVESEHGFKATKQMYKKRLAKWGLQKNTRRLTLAEPGGLLTEKSKCQNFTTKSVKAPRTGGSIPSSPLINQVDKLMLTLFINVRTWALAYFEPSMQPESLGHSTPHHSLLAWPPKTKSINFTFKLVIDLLDREQGDLAGRMARKAFMLAEGMLTLDGPAFVWDLLEIMHHMISLRHMNLFHTLLAHVTALACTKKPENHPLSAILRALWSLVATLTHAASTSIASPSSSLSSSSSSSPSSGSPSSRMCRRQPIATLDSLQLSRALTPLIEQAWNANAEIVFDKFDPHFFHLYCRMVWDSCSIRPSAFIINTADQWLNRLSSDALRESATVSNFEPHHTLAEGAEILQRLFTVQPDTTSPRSYEMLRARSTAALRRCGDAIAGKEPRSHNHTALLLSILSSLASVNILEELPAIPQRLGTTPDDVWRLQAGIFACIVKLLVDLDSDSTSEELWAVLDKVERVRAIVIFREYAEGKIDPQVIRELWLLREALLGAGKIEEAARVEQDVYQRIEKYMEDIPDHSA